MSELRQLWIPCQDCDGFAPSCETCHGYGFEPVYRCPWCSVEPEVAELVALHSVWPQALPIAGGIYDQPAGYVQAMRFLTMAHGIMERELRKELERERAKG